MHTTQFWQVPKHHQRQREDHSTFEHLFEDHEHVTCTDNTTHLHESTLHCSIDAFSFSSFNMSFDTPLFSDEIIPYPKRNYNYQRHHFILDKRFIKLRGPPGLTT